MRRVCYFGAYDPDYPRNRILRAGLRAAGIEVRQCCAPSRWRAWRRYPALAARFTSASRGAQVLLVGEFRHKDMPLARCLKGSRCLVFDPFVSREDTLVHDWRKHAPRSWQARWNRLWDRVSLKAADLVLCDTWAHGDLYQELGAPRSRLRRVLVGAEQAFFAVPPRASAETVRLLYAGGFLPLHGVPILLEAAARLEATVLDGIELVLAGSGRDYEPARRQAAELGLRRTRFLGPWPYAKLPELIEQADIVLGIFDAGDKASRVIPHKVYQGLAAGRAVVTGDSPALREVFEPERHLIAVPRGDAAALAEGLRRLIADRALRARLGGAARERATAVATPEAVGRELARAIFGGAEARAD